MIGWVVPNCRSAGAASTCPRGARKATGFSLACSVKVGDHVALACPGRSLQNGILQKLRRVVGLTPACVRPAWHGPSEMVCHFLALVSCLTRFP